MTHTQVVPPANRPVVLDSNSTDLLNKFNELARSINTVNATAELKATTGSEYSGVVDQYHEVKVFLLAAKPASIRMIGQVPVVGTTVFDMASDGREFEVSIPSRKEFLDGKVSVTRTSNKPIENLRPQHLIDALVWSEVQKEEQVLFEEENEENARYYVLSVLRGGYQTEILRRIWFDRANLNVARLELFAPQGLLVSDIRYSDWQPANPAESPGAANTAAIPLYPRKIRLSRPHDDYQLDLAISKVALNTVIEPSRFQLDAPAGVTITHIQDNAGSVRP